MYFQIKTKQMAGADDETNEWLDIVLRMTGADKQLSKLLADLEPRIHEMDERIYPTVRQLEAAEDRWKSVLGSLTAAQREGYRRKGYTFLGAGQRRAIYKSLVAEGEFVFRIVF
jgi:hypothetical protein